MANKNTNTFVKNVNGTGSDPYANSESKTESSWLATAGEEGSNCAVRGCGKPADVGAHVMDADGRKGNDWGITPMCQAHNNSNNQEEMALKKSASVTPLRPENRE